MTPNWNDWLAAMDMYIFDQLRKGNLREDMRILDAGCGHGRNIHYFLKAGSEVWAFDQSRDYVEEVRAMAKSFQQDFDVSRIQHADGSEIPFEDGTFDAVFSSAVLHFARDDNHFEKMLSELVRVLAKGGLLIMRIAWQPADNVVLRSVGNNHFLHPDDFDYYLPPYTVEAFVARLASLGIRQVEHPKVTQVHGLRAMSTWVGVLD